jgi:hypothetical protein
MKKLNVTWDVSAGMEPYLQATRLVDLTSASVRETTARLVQGAATPREAAVRIYHFVRDEIEFGYNHRDDIPASEVLRDGYGQCNTKSVLLVALLRTANIPARFHLAQVDKAIQWGVMPPLAYRFAPSKITHSWAEVHLPFDQAHDKDGRWIVLEGAIMDRHYFLAARRLLLESGLPVGYAIGLPPEVLASCADGRCIDWDGVHDVTCQMTAVVADFGPAADPRAFYRQHGVSRLGSVLFECHTSQEMTERAARIRHGEKP